MTLRKRDASEPIKISRRTVLAGVPVAAALTLVSKSSARAAEPARRPRIAVLATEYRKLCHTEVIVDRFLEGFGWESEHYHPQVDVVSLFVDQVADGDLTRDRAARFPQMKTYPTVEAALCSGGDKLAVDGVVIIGEHGNYQVNEKGQTLYPRYEWFQKTVEVFKKSGRTVPVFNDKHLSWKWEWAREMVDTAERMGFPFMAASSVPISWRLPSVELPLGAKVEEIVAVGNGNPDSYDFHALEAIQCLAERRQGGETGVVRLEAMSDAAVWKALKAGSWASGGWDPKLFAACLCRSHTLVPAREGFGHTYPTDADLQRMVTKPVAYRYEHADGLKATMLLLNGITSDITVAVKIKGQAEPLSTNMTTGGTNDTQPHNFDILVKHIEEFMLTGKPPCPLARTLLTTGLVCAGVDSLAQGGARLDTPHLAIRYQPNPNSTFRRT